MAQSTLAFKIVQRRMNTATMVINFLGALISFLYFTIIDPPQRAKSHSKGLNGPQ